MLDKLWLVTLELEHEISYPLVSILRVMLLKTGRLLVELERLPKK